MVYRTDGASWVVRLGVTRSGGWRDWGAVSGQFERHLAAQASERILEPHIESESRRGSDHVRITVLMNVRAADVAEALSAAWWAFRKAADDGWDLASAVADVRPGEELIPLYPPLIAIGSVSKLGRVLRRVAATRCAGCPEISGLVRYDPALPRLARSPDGDPGIIADTYPPGSGG